MATLCEADLMPARDPPQYSYFDLFPFSLLLSPMPGVGTLLKQAQKMQEEWLYEGEKYREGRGDGAKAWVHFERSGVKLLVLKFANLRPVAD